MNLKLHHSAPALFVAAVLYHIAQLFLLRHDGRGLPRSPALLGLLSAGLVVVSVLVASVTEPELSGAAAAAITCVILLFVWQAGRLFRCPPAYSAYLFALLGQRGLELVVHYAGLPPQSILIGAWVGVAMGSLYVKTSRAQVAR